MDILDAPWDYAFYQAYELTAFYSRRLAALLATRDATLFVTSLPAGKLIVVRAVDGNSLSMQVVAFDRISGIAVDRERMAVASVGTQVWLLDTCFRVREAYTTGEIASHEIAWGADALWIVNTRYSCLCTPDPTNGFSLRWQPPFITELVPEDRCHLNGLAMAGGAPKYVTCFSTTNRASGWRGDPASGCLIDVPFARVVAAKLTMPHSPRVHDGRVLVLDSGTGRLLRVDVDAGSVEPIAKFKGFLRGLAFSGSTAFVGLSKTRHLKIGLPLVESLGDGPGNCGVWTVDLETGRSAGFIEFVTGIDEVFDVQLVHSSGSE